MNNSHFLLFDLDVTRPSRSRAHQFGRDRAQNPTLSHNTILPQICQDVKCFFALALVNFLPIYCRTLKGESQISSRVKFSGGVKFLRVSNFRRRKQLGSACQIFSGAGSWVLSNFDRRRELGMSWRAQFRLFSAFDSWKSVKI